MKQYSRVLSYLITVLIGLAMAVAVFAYRGGFSQPDAQSMYSALSDACFVPGIFMTGIGLMVLVANEGFFDILSYGMHSLVTLFTPFKRKEEHQRYYEYKVARAERRTKPQNIVLRVGIVFLLLAGLCLVLLSATGYELLPS